MVNSFKNDYNNAFVEDENSGIKVIKRVSNVDMSFRNFKTRIILVERYIKYKRATSITKGLL